MGKSEWISVSIKPEETAKGVFCLIERKGKLYPETCYYFNKHQQDFCPDGNEDWADFENDEYYLPEGWYTLCDQCEKYWKVEPSFYLNGIEYPNSQSPEPTSAENAQVQFDTLEEGDWFQGTDEEYRKVLKLENHDCFKRNGNNWIKAMLLDEHCVFSDSGLYWQSPALKKTQLTPSEFLRRAENTFKKK